MQDKAEVIKSFTHIFIQLQNQRVADMESDDADSGTGSVDCMIPSNPTTMVVVHVDPLSRSEVINTL